jgi:hypothetical protein
MKLLEHQAEIEHRLRQIAWPEPTPGLRVRVLSAVLVVGSRVTWSDRIWFSRAWRLAAAATLAGGITLDSLSDTTAVARFTPGPHALADAQVLDDTGPDIGLPADFVASLARRALAGPPPGATDRQRPLAFEAFEREGERR